MTADPITPADEAPVPQRIQSRPTKRDPNLDQFPFCWDYWIPNPADPYNPEPGYDDRVLIARRPKQAVLLHALQVLGEVEETADDEIDLSSINALHDFLDKMLVEESAAYVQERLQDPKDPRDIDPDLVDLITTLVGKWYGGPAPKAPAGVASRASQRPRSTTGKRSTGASRSKGSTRKNSPAGGS